MAQYDSEKLQLAVADMIAVSIGDKLSTQKMKVDGVLVDVPSIILAHSMSSEGKPVTPPPYPFVMLEDTTIEDSLAEEINQYLDEDGNLIRERTMTSRINVKIFGTVRDGVVNIAHNLDYSFVIDDYRDMIEEGYGDNCRWIMNAKMPSTKTTANEVYMEVASFDAYFSLIEQHIQENVDTFDEVILDPRLIHINGIPLRSVNPIGTSLAFSSFMSAGNPLATATGYTFVPYE